MRQDFSPYAPDEGWRFTPAPKISRCPEIEISLKKEDNRKVHTIFTSGSIFRRLTVLGTTRKTDWKLYNVYVKQ